MPILSTNPIVTIPMITPFDGTDRVDHEAIATNVAHWIDTPLSGYIIGTASGEEAFLSEDEKLAIVRTVSDLLHDERFVVGGIDCPSASETLRRAEAFAQAGAEMVRLRLPRYKKAVVPYFEDVLPRCPVPTLLMHQCNPERFDFAGEAATDHDIRFETRVRQFVPENRRFFICNGSLALTGAFIGCNGITTAFSNIWPEALHKILNLGMAGEYEGARALQRSMQNIDAVMLPYQAAGMKAALNLMGLKGTQPRSPMPPMPETEVERLRVIMQRAGLLAQ